MIRVVLYQQDTEFAKKHLPRDASVPMGCLEVSFHFGEEVHVDHTWLAGQEMHCPFDQDWLREHIEVLWLKLGRSMCPNEVLNVMRVDDEMRDFERERHDGGEHQEDAGS